MFCIATKLGCDLLEGLGTLATMQELENMFCSFLPAMREHIRVANDYIEGQIEPNLDLVPSPMSKALRLMVGNAMH